MQIPPCAIWGARSDVVTIFTLFNKSRESRHWTIYWCFAISLYSRVTLTCSCLARCWVRSKHSPGSPTALSVWCSCFLNYIFPQGWIGRGGVIPWPPRSQYITTLDSFLWVHVKYKFYRTPVQNLQQLKMRTASEIRIMGHQTLENVWMNIKGGLDALIFRNGWILYHI